MSERQMETWLQEALDFVGHCQEPSSEEPRVQSVTPFEEAGVMTRNRGLVVCLNDGSAFQVTIVKSR